MTQRPDRIAEIFTEGGIHHALNALASRGAKPPTCYCGYLPCQCARLGFSRAVAPKPLPEPQRRYDHPSRPYAASPTPLHGGA